VNYHLQRILPNKPKWCLNSTILNNQRAADELQKLVVSGCRIAQIFTQEYGVSPREYAINLRIQSAKNPLLQTTLPIIDIAYSLGFERLSAFFHFLETALAQHPESTEITKENLCPQQTALLRIRYGFWTRYDC
jgi:methylphosphotriester-DNA--protein-cysteine methyltransferase